MKKIWIFVLSVSLLTGCASTEKRRLEPVERLLKTDGTTTMLFHSTLYYPTELSLRFDGYIVGIEKSPRDKISSPEDLRIKGVEDAGLDQTETENKLIDSKLLFISHIMQNSADQNGLGNCTIYNAYNLKETPEVQQLSLPCQGFSHPPILAKEAYKTSWDALGNLETSMSRRIAKGNYSHIVVITMGWNTVQEEAVRNFNSIVTNLKRAAGPDFKPLVVGVTWPSQWQSDWFGPIYKILSFPIKSADADELGLSWLGVLLHQTLPKIKGNLPVVVIGHSFGSRASSVAACVGPAIYDKDPQLERSQIEALVNFQGAFLSNRLFGEQDRGFHYPVLHQNEGSVDHNLGCFNVKNIVLTSSIYDTAMNSAIWGVYAGDERSYSKMCDGDSVKIRCGKADSMGHVPSFTSNPTGSNVTYIDASDLVHENAYLSGGGAHSDIYRKEHGILLKEVLNLQ